MADYQVLAALLVVEIATEIHDFGFAWHYPKGTKHLVDTLKFTFL
jgi:hypothetical protein